MMSNDRARHSQRSLKAEKQAGSLRLVSLIVRTEFEPFLCIITIQIEFLFNLESLDTLEVREQKLKH